jgi:integrase
MRLTAQEIARYRPPQGKSDHIVFDEELSGFGLRYRSGRRTWVFQYAFGAGESRVNARMTLGDYPALPPAKARETAQDLYAKVRLGQHPAADKKVTRNEARNTFGRLVHSYLEFQQGQLRERSYVEVERYLDRYARALHGLPATAVDRKRIADLLDSIARHSGPVAANRARTNLSALFAWAMRKGLHDQNPVIATETRKEKSRHRVLSDNELAVVWNTLPKSDYGDILKLLILTGQREREIGDLHWSEIDFDEELISLPPERTKNARPHEIPMSSAVRDILKARTRSDDRDLVFGFGAGGFSGWGKSKERLDKAIADRLGKPLPHWTVHDLRRTAATRMVDLGEGPHVVEAVLNHVSGHRAGVAGIYNRSLYKAEKAQALSKWATHVLAIAKGKKSNVTPIRGRA